MVSSLGLKTIGEVVETEAGAEALQRAGCDFGQGYFFCEPVESEEALKHLRAQDLRVPHPSVDQHRAVGEEVAPAETGSAAEMGGPTVAPADVVATPTASDAYEKSPTPVSEESVVLPVDDFQTPAKLDETQVLPIPDSQTPAKLDETQVLPIPDSQTPAKLDETQVLPIPDSQTPAKSDETQVLPPVPLAFPTDDSPTQMLSLDELALPIHDSPILEEPDELGSAPESGGKAPPESAKSDTPDAARNDTPGIRRTGRRRAR
jgi:hypothetical protein